MQPVKRRRHASNRGMLLTRSVILVQLAIALVVAWFLFTSTGLRLPFSASPYTVKVTLPNAAGLAAVNHPEVTVAGVREGTVTGVRLTDGHAVVTAQLDASARGKLFANATVSIYPRSDLNDLVMDILPGTPSAGALRSQVIHASADARPVGYDQVLDTFNDETRAYAQILIGTLQNVLAHRSGPLADALRSLPSVTTSVTQLAQQVDTRRAQLEALVGQFDQIVTATGERGRQLTQAIGLARDTLQVVAARQQTLETAMHRLPSFLTSLHGAFNSLGSLAGNLNPALTKLQPVARALPAALRSTRRLVPALANLTRHTTALANAGTAPLAALQGMLAGLGAAAPKLTPVVKTTDLFVSTLVKNEPDIMSMVSTWPGALSEQTGVGITTRTDILRTDAIDPAVFGLPGDSNVGGPVPLRSSSQLTALENAVARVKGLDPQLFADAPANEPIELQAVRAPLTLLCLQKSYAACMVLSSIDAHPPKVL